MTIINPFDQIDQRLRQIEKDIHQLLEKEQEPKKKEETPDIGGIELAMHITGKAKQTIYQLVSTRQIPHFRKSGKLYFSKNDLLAWIKSGIRQTRDDLREDAEKCLTRTIRK